MTRMLHTDPQGLRPYSDVLAEYREQWPLLDAYRRVIEENNGHDGPITEPPANHGVDNVTAAARALAEIGKPADQLSAMMALAFIKRLEMEIGVLSAPEPPTISCMLVGYFFQFSDHVPDVEAWASMDADEQRYMLDELADQVPGELLPEILRLAMPALLAHVIAEDEQARRKHMSPRQIWEATRRANIRDEHQADEKPQDWMGLLGAAALDLPDTPEGHAEGRAYVDQLVTHANSKLGAFGLPAGDQNA